MKLNRILWVFSFFFALAGNWAVSDDFNKSGWGKHHSINQVSLKSTDPVLQLTEVSVTQKITSESSETFQDRVLYSKTFAENDRSPVILILNGEWEMNADSVSRVFGPLAKELKANVVSTEHRFYGKSQPSRQNGLSTEDLKSLSIEKAIDDIAVIQKQLTRDLSLHGPWVVVGVSYSGTMAVYYRLARPELVSGAIAFSAPLWVTPNGFDQYEAVAVRAFGPELTEKTRRAVSYILDQNSTEAGHAWIQKKFAMPNSDFSLEDLMAILVSDVPQIAQAGLIKEFKVAMDAARTDLDLAQALIDELVKCLGEHFWEESPYGAKSDPGVINEFSRWVFQAFTQFGWLYVTSADRKESFLPVSLGMSYYEREYSKIFPGFKGLGLGDYAKQMQKKFLSEGSRLVLVNGSFDPWSAIAYSDYQDPARDISSIIVPGGSHGASFYPIKTDPLAAEYPAQRLYLKKFSEWFNTY